MSRNQKNSSVAIIQAVRTPLAFLTLGLLITDSVLGGLAVKFSESRSLLIWAIIVSLGLFVGIVVTLAVIRPEALSGTRPWQPTYAGRLADDLYAGLEGAIANLEPVEREEAWATVADVLVNDSSLEPQYLEFCTQVSERLKKRANLASKTSAPRGVIGT